MNRDEMSNIYRGSSKDASYHVLVHLAKLFQRNQPIRYKNCLWRTCLLMDQDEMSKLYREPYYQVSECLAKRFQRRRFFRNQPIKNSNGLWRPYLYTGRDEMNNLYRGPSIDASYQVSLHLVKEFQRWRFQKIGQSETRIALKQSETRTTDTKWWQKVTLPLARWAKKKVVH